MNFKPLFDGVFHGLRRNMKIARENEIFSQIATQLPAVSVVLVFAPHPDDEIFGCGGTLALLRDSGADIHIHILTDGSKGGEAPAEELVVQREKESLAAAMALDLAPPQFWRLPDRSLSYGELLISQIMQTVETVSPDLVFLPSPAEIHPDHQVLAFAGIEACKRRGDSTLVAFYELSAPLATPNLFIDISSVIRLKTRAMECFSSQLEHLPYIERIQGLNAFRSYNLGANSSHAEAYIIVCASELEGGAAYLFGGALVLRRQMGFAASGEDLPLVSIVVRSMNLSTLDEALNSIALQTYANIEVVLVNAKGGEHRDCGSVCGRFPLVILNNNKAPLSRPQAANMGLTACRGIYICFLDDDDTIDAGHIQQLVEAIHNADSSRVFYSGVRVIDRKDPHRKIRRTFAEPNVDFARLLLGNIIPIHAVLFPAVYIHNGLRFDESLAIYEDWDFWLQLSRKAELSFVEKVSATYFTHGRSAVGAGETLDPNLKDEAENAVLEKWVKRLSASELQKVSACFHRSLHQRSLLENSNLEALEQISVKNKIIDTLNRNNEEIKRSIEEQRQKIDQHQRKAEKISLENQRQPKTLKRSCDQKQLQIEEHEMLISNLYSSTSWKITAPLRLAVNLFRNRKIIEQKFKRHGGFLPFIRRFRQILRQEGFAGIQQRSSQNDTSDSHFSPRETAHLSLPHNQPLVAHHQSVDVIVCVHNAREDVRLCLESVMRTIRSCVRVIVIDDGSDTETRDFLREYCVGQPIELIRNEAAQGYTLAANIGLRASSAEFVVLLNSDTIVPSRWLDRLVRCAISADTIGIVGPISNTASWQSVPHIFDQQGDWAENSLPLGWTVEDYAGEVGGNSRTIYPRVGFLNGFCLMMKRALIDDIGIFDEKTFASGYGEENDYCLRAQAKGWQLVVADDCYVYHAQSKSYSHDLRQKLACQADEALALKHGRSTIDHYLNLTRHHPALTYLRYACEDIPALKKLREETTQSFEGKRILFLLPAVTAGGGGNVVLLECETLRAQGVDAWIGNLAANRKQFEKHHPGISVPVLYLDTPSDLVSHASGFDAVIATLYLTVYWLKPLLEIDICPVLGYYIQDFEPEFFPKNSRDYEIAMRSYKEIPSLVHLTKTRWNQQKLLNEIGVHSNLVGIDFSVDKFFPSRLPSADTNAVRISAMIRPSTPRRAPQMTVDVLRQIKEKYQQRVSITVFGVNPASPEYAELSPDFEHQSFGELTTYQVGVVLRDTDIFIDCSTFQAMGLTAMEAMACGAVVVGPLNGGLGEIVAHGESGLLVDTEKIQNILEAIVRLVDDPSLRRQMRDKALRVNQHYPEKTTAVILNALFAAPTEQACVAEKCQVTQNG